LITVAVCTRNRVRWLEQAVDSVLSQITDDTQILIVDNASTDATPQVAARLAATHPCVAACLENQLGLSAVRNRALANPCGKYVIFLDDDAEAEPGWLDAYRRFFSAPPASRIACVGGVVCPVHEVLPPRWLKSNSNVLNWSDRTQPFKDRAGPWGCNFALHRLTALELGGFNARLGRKGKTLHAHEESDLLERLRLSGYGVWWLPSARIRHFVAAERLRLNWQLRSQFNQGRSSALMRLGMMSRARERWLFSLGRLLVAPFHCALNLLVALVSWPFQQGRLAAHALMRAARIGGVTWQLLMPATRR